MYAEGVMQNKFLHHSAFYLYNIMLHISYCFNVVRGHPYKCILRGDVKYIILHFPYITLCCILATVSVW